MKSWQVHSLAETNVRLIAVRIMTSLVRDGKSLAELLPVAQEQLEVRDAAFLQQLTFGACRTSLSLIHI